MKKSFISLLSTVLALLMLGSILCGSLVACTGNEETTGTGSIGGTGEQTTEPTETTDSNKTTGTESSSENNPDSDSSPNGTDGETEEGDSSEATDSNGDVESSDIADESADKNDDPEETEDFVGPTVEKDGQFAPSIKYAEQMANGVQSYYTESERNNYRIENLNMNLLYSLKDTKVVSAITNKNGGTYVQDTMDVFVTMNNGTTIYSSGSSNNIRPNIYRLGYYYYDVHFLENDFVGKLNIKKSIDLDESIFSQTNNTTVKVSGSEIRALIQGSDPYIVMSNEKNVTFAASEYNAIQFSIKSDKVDEVKIYFLNDSMTGHDDAAVVNTSVLNDGEYHTYTVMLSSNAAYKGTIGRIRIDFEGTSPKDLVYIKDISIVDAEAEGIFNLFLDRTFHTYSDKLHQELHFVATHKVTGIKEVGMVTRIAADTVDKLIVKDSAEKLHTTLDGVDWSSAEYVGFDIKGVGIFGYILPVHDNAGKIKVELVEGNYVITQTVTPKDGTIDPIAVDDPATENVQEAKVTNTQNDFYTGNRIYTDTNHSFDKFIEEANWEREPLKAVSSNSYVGYDALRGAYTFNISGTGFNPPFFYEGNYHHIVTTKIRSDVQRPIYIRTITSSGCLENAAILNEKELLLPIMPEVSKNFGGENEEPLFFAGDMTYGETVFPLMLPEGERIELSILNLYQNWGAFPLKQLSSIQYFWPYYHLSVGTTETSCISPWYGARDLWTLPDFRSQSMPYWYELDHDKGYSNQPQHTHAGFQYFLQYTDADGVYNATENISNVIDSAGPVYVDVEMTYISDDSKIKVTYNHIEMPQEDELRAYYEIKYEILEEVTIKDFANDFSFYSFEGYSGYYQQMGYWSENGDADCVVHKATNGDETPEKLVLGNDCPYVALYDLYVADETSSWKYNNANLGFVIHSSEIVLGGNEITDNFVVTGKNYVYSLSMDLGEVTLKPGDTINLNMIITPWGHYNSTIDTSMQKIRENTCLNPLTVEVSKGEKIESVYVPKVLSTDGKSAEFTLSGGTDNVVVRAYGFNKLTAPKIYELVDGEYVDDGTGNLTWVEYTQPAWKEYVTSSINTPDKMGNKHYYDGYYVYYDGDGTYSYAFAVDMTDADSRTFKIVAEEEFKHWPVINVGEGDGALLNVYIPSSTLYSITNGTIKGISKTELSDDGTFVRYYGDGLGTGEAYFEVFRNKTDSLTATGRYVVLKYRIPTSNCTLGRIEFFTTTDPDVSMTKCSLSAGTTYTDGEWHIMIVDTVGKGHPHFAPADSDETYYAQYLRIDIFNSPMTTDCYFDIAYIGLTDDITKVFEIEKLQEEACDKVVVYGANNSYVAYDLEGNEVDKADSAPAVSGQVGEKSYIQDGNNRGYTSSGMSYVSGIDFINGIGDGDPTEPAFNGYRSHEVTGPMVIDFDGPTVGNAYLAMAGWTLVHGGIEGIESYVWSADGGKTWYTAELYPSTKTLGAAAGGIKNAGDGHFATQVENFNKDTYDQANYANSVYQGTANAPMGIAAHLTDYIGKEVNVTFAVVPKAEPGTLCIIAHIKNVRVYESDASAAENEKCDHSTPHSYVFVDDGNANTEEAKITKKCKCGETSISTDLPSYVLFINKICGVDVAPTAPDNSKGYVTINSLNHKVGENTTTFAVGSDGLLTFNGWAGLNGGIGDIVFKVLDANGNELTNGWTSTGTALTDRTDLSGEMIKRNIEVVYGKGYNISIDLAEYIASKDQTVTVKFAFVAAGAPASGNDKYVYVCEMTNLKVPCEPK